jgi:hypothetical protein
MAQPPDARHEVTVLIQHRTTLRDCWMDGEYLVVRHVKFAEDGQGAEVTKVFRFAPDEIGKLINLVQEKTNNVTEKR